MTEVSIRILFVAFLGHGLQAIMRNLKGKYKISVFPCSRILSDGRLVITKDKFKLMNQIIQNTRCKRRKVL